MRHFSGIFFASSLLVSFLLCDLFFQKIFYGKFLLGKNFLLERYRENLLKEQLYRFDPTLGWNLNRKINTEQSSPDSRFTKQNRFSMVRTDQYGFRITPNTWKISLSKKKILALGDSFTFGAEVNDSETWPAHLQALLKTKVLNGGVSGFGLDQMYLKLSDDIRVHRPSMIIMSIMNRTLLRTALTHRISQPFGESREKPFFKLQSRDLKQTRAHLTDTIFHGRLDPIRNFLGSSALVDWFFNAYFPSYWHQAAHETEYPVGFKTGEDPLQLSCRLLKKSHELAAKYGAKLVVLSQAYHVKERAESGGAYWTDPLLKAVLTCYSNNGEPVLDLDAALHQIFNDNRHLYHSLFFWGKHMTNQGNLYVAQSIEQFLQGQNLL
ncbi:MAG: hypothetical protein EBQ85_00185 [Proteobacteria bacterium]|nr:hypothetical protein [Pseudomonadota bacterium]